jgi:hypothetical protein
MRRQSRRTLAYLSAFPPLPISAATLIRWRECEPCCRNDFDARVMREMPCDD